MPDTSDVMRPRDKWIPWYFVAFFVVLALLDGIFVWLAMSTHRGVVTEQSYQKGLRYNNTLLASDAQDALAWQGTITMKGAALAFSLRDQYGESLQVAEVTAHFTRPIESGYDFSTRLEETAPGVYKSDVSFPLKGQWDVTISASWNNQPYQKTQRIIVN